MTIGKDSSNPSYGSTTPLAIPVNAANAETVTFDEEQRESSSLLAVKVEELHDDDEFRPLYQDKWWALAFLVHLAVMICLGVMFGSFGIDSAALSNMNVTAVLEDETDVDEADIQKFNEFSKQVEDWIEIYPQRILTCLILPGVLVAFVITYVWTAFILRSCPKAMVTACLLGSIVWTILIALSISLASQSIFSFIGSAAMIGIITYYVCIVWKLIPFAAVNLNVSLKAISRNWGMYLVALLFSVLSFVWTIFWLYTTIGLLGYQTEQYNKQHPADSETTRPSSKGAGSYESDDLEEGGGPQGITVVFLLISLYWTATVLLNTVQVTVAGVTGTYCYDIQDASSCCSPAVTSSLQRSLSYSFGSICFGSLLQALITVLRIMVENARNQQRQSDDNNACGAILLCILECIVRLLEDIIDYFNQWAYVYVGIYGYSYLESGKKVVELFRARGWTSLVTNNLVGYVLGFSTFTVAILSGLLTMALENVWNQMHGVDSYVLGPVSGQGWVAFGLGLFIGIVVSSVMMNVIQGAVNTLIVCYADDPGKLEENHPKDARLVAEAWVSVFPDSGVRVSQYNVDV